ncbi:MAG: hypothetical protein QG599_2733 [Pseudomonadota bacterium]|nr:hypothetical protein [Pseudomonadota bacterium]
MKARLYVLIAALLMTGVIGPWKAAFAVESVVLNQQAIESSQAWTYLLNSANQGWFAYYAEKDNSLYVRRPDGTEVQLGATDRQRQQSGLAITPTGQDLAVLWRDKLPAKALYFLPGVGGSSLPQPVIAGGEESEPLTRLKMSQRDNVAYLLWLGEKADVQPAPDSDAAKTSAVPSSPRQLYHLYFRYTEDSGKTFSPVEKVLPGYYPTWIVDKKVIPVFSWYSLDGQLSLVMRVFDRAQKRFGEPVKVVDAPPITPIYDAFESGGRWFVLWVGQYGDNGEQVLEGVVSADQGRTWKRFVFESLRGLDFSRIDATGDGRGHVLISVSGSWRFRDDDTKAKNDIYILRSTDHGVTWSEPYQPRAVALRRFEARDPSAVFGGKPGSVMVVWEDWRDIRPGVYVQFSNDYGTTWGDAVVVDPKPSSGLGQDFRNKTAFAIGDRYQVLVKRYRDAALKQFDLVRYEATPAEWQQQAAESAQQKQERMSEPRLRERVTVFWKAMQDEDWAAAYAINDPFFQAKMPFSAYGASRGLIKYHGYELLEITREGNIARVRGRFEASIPEFVLKGKPYSRERQSYEKTETWLFVDGDWRREYHEEAQDIRFTRY